MELDVSKKIRVSCFGIIVLGFCLEEVLIFKYSVKFQTAIKAKLMELGVHVGKCLQIIYFESIKAHKQKYFMWTVCSFH